MTHRLILSFWNICVHNLPQGVFERRTLTSAAARNMIVTARASRVLLCVTKDDLLAPYRERERRRHAELRALLLDAHDIALRLEDFLFESVDEADRTATVVPLEVAELHPGDSMLIVDCSYAFAAEGTAKDFDDRFVIAEDSLRFELVTAIAPLAGQAA